MKTINPLKTNLIDKILAIKSEDLLKALDSLIVSSSPNEIVLLSEEQKIMLQMSEDDISNQRLTSQEDVDKEDLKWLKDQ